MFAYYLRLALQSFRRNPGLTALMVMRHRARHRGVHDDAHELSRGGAQPDLAKNDMLFAPYDRQLGSGATLRQGQARALRPTMLTYRDATALYASDIPDRKVIMYKAGGIAARGGQEHGAGVRRRRA